MFFFLGSPSAQAANRQYIVFMPVSVAPSFHCPRCRPTPALGRFWDGSKTVMLDKSPAFLTQAPKIAAQLREKGMRSAFIVMSHSACTMSTSPHGLELRGNTNPTHLYQLPNVTTSPLIPL